MEIPPPPEVPQDWSKQFFDSKFIEIFSYLDKFKDTYKDSKALILLLDLPKSSKVLDIPCGFGRFSKLLCDAGLQVTGVDNSKHLLARASEMNPGPTYIIGDMRAPPKGPFDAILNLWTSFGYFDSHEEDQQMLISWFDQLKIGGQLIMELTDIERAMAENAQSGEQISYKKREKNSVIEEAWIDWKSTVATIAYSLGEYKIVGKTRLYSKDQLFRMLRTAGFADLRAFGGFDRRPKTPSDRLVVQAIK